MIRVLTVFGTRPEAIKLAPVVREIAGRRGEFSSAVCVTAQHRQMLDQVLDFFALRPDFDLDLMRDDQSLADLTAAILRGVSGVIEKVRPDWVLVQGDTTTCMAAGLLAFYHKVRLGHVEAGLRTMDSHSPFPEEMNRRLVGQMADLHFCPTERSRDHLLREGIPEGSIAVTGNTVVDALLWARAIIGRSEPAVPQEIRAFVEGKRVILVTGHRRESFGAGFERICGALGDLAGRLEGTVIVYPVHLNPNVRSAVNRILAGRDNVLLTEPLSYPQFIWLMDRAHVLLTDSGGIQEEAPSLGKPVLVMRDKTERVEGLEAGTALLVGTDRERIVEGVTAVMTDRGLYDRMAGSANPYGDGCASRRIADRLAGGKGP